MLVHTFKKSTLFIMVSALLSGCGGESTSSSATPENNNNTASIAGVETPSSIAVVTAQQ